MIDELPPPPAPPPAPPGALLTVVGCAYHQPPDADPVAAEIRFERRLTTSEQVYKRVLQVTEQWRPLDCGWLKDVGASFMVLANDPPRFATNPTDEQRAAALAKVIEVYFAPSPAETGEPRTMFSPKRFEQTPYAAILVHPGEQQSLTPADASRVLIRCRVGVARCTLHLFPR